MAIAILNTRDQARNVVNLVNSSLGRKVLKQPAKKGDQGWSPVFAKGGRNVTKSQL